MKAIIIGATSGLGRETAIRLIREGWELGLAGRRIEELEAIKREFGTLQSTGDTDTAGSAGEARPANSITVSEENNIHIAQIDVTKEEATERLDDLILRLGSPDLLLYVSGVGYQNRALDLEKEIRTVRTNCEGMVRIVDHFVNYVRKNPSVYNKGHKAHIAVVTSVAGTKGIGAAPAYSATKKMGSTYISALVQLSRIENIPVVFTDIRPGFVATALLNPDKHYPMMMTREQAGEHIMKAIKRRARVYTFDWRYCVLVFFWRLVPNCIWERITWAKN